MNFIAYEQLCVTFKQVNKTASVTHRRLKIANIVLLNSTAKDYTMPLSYYYLSSKCQILQLCRSFRSAFLN